MMHVCSRVIRFLQSPSEHTQDERHDFYLFLFIFLGGGCVCKLQEINQSIYLSTPSMCTVELTAFQSILTNLCAL